MRDTSMGNRGLAARLALAALLLPVAAAAHEPVVAQGAPPLGAETRGWVELQQSNHAAMAAPRPMPGEVADRVYARYLDSFSHPIPETFERESFKSGSQ